MYLKKLDIQGFKSFADKVSLNFEKGITVIVGPNGSGKSNISDAVRLVLGEQSIKSLRGTKLEDVIFAGSENRKPLGFCEINLTLDNSDSILPFDYAEVVVTRKIYRSGESEFFINKTPCRLKDIYELFLDTGIGRDGYSIIGQGKIDEILNTRPEDRRQIFEEAAGISKYRYKKEEAEKKLIATNENIVRLNDIISELEKQLNPLLIQKNKAEKFIQINKEKKEVDVSLYVYKIDDLTREYNRYMSDYEVIKTKLHEKKSELCKYEENISKKEYRINKIKESIDLKKEEYYNKSKEIETVNGKLELIREKIKNFSETLVLYNNDVNKSENKIRILTEEIKKIDKNIAEMYTQKNILTENLTKITEKYNLIKNAEQNCTIEVEQAKADMVDILNNIADVKSKFILYRSLKEDACRKRDNLLKSTDKVYKEIEQLKNKSKGICDEIDALKNDFGSVLNDKDLKKLELSKIDDEIRKIEKTIEQMSQMYNNKKSRLYALEEMEKNYDGYNNTIKNLLKKVQFNSKFRDNIIGVVGELIEVDNKYQAAIEVALGSSIQNVVIKSINNVEDLIKVLKSENLGRATFLPLDSVQPKQLYGNELKILKESGVIGVASDLIGYRQELENIFKFLLGRVIVTNDLKSAINLSKKLEYQYKFVTLDGEIINPGGSITGGSLKLKVQNILKRKEEIRELSRQISSVESEMNNLLNIKNTLYNKKANIEDVIKKIDGKLSEIEYKINYKKEELLNLEREKDKLKNQIEDYKFEVYQIEDNLSNYDSEISRYENELSELEKKKEDINLLIEKYKESQSDKIEIIRNLEKEITEFKIEIAKNEQKLQNEVHKSKERQQEFDIEKNNILNKKISIENIKKEEQKLYSEENLYKNKIIALKQDIEKLKDEISDADNTMLQELNNLEKYKSKLLDMKNEYSIILQNKHDIEINLQKIQLEIDNIKNRLLEEYELTYDSALKFLIKKDINYLKERSTYLSKTLKEIGNVNLDSIEEYKSVKERYDFLKYQMEDILKAKESLISMIEETNKIIKTRFKDSFELIHIKFKETFKRLFGGGRAELVLTDENNLLETGIEINVQPPGKKLQNISLLSGGEKALVAISLLFAMISIRPTPFCILDEIDAALDDANVDRFAQYLKELSNNTQFIIVTHRKGTMSISDIMYGVTMQEKGVSKLLSLKLEKDKI